ncbi:hypothetical protein GCM10027259_29960 [Micromonospora palomenae]
MRKEESHTGPGATGRGRGGAACRGAGAVVRFSKARSRVAPRGGQPTGGARGPVVPAASPVRGSGGAVTGWAGRPTGSIEVT